MSNIVQLIRKGKYTVAQFAADITNDIENTAAVIAVVQDKDGNMRIVCTDTTRSVICVAAVMMAVEAQEAMTTP